MNCKQQQSEGEGSVCLFLLKVNESVEILVENVNDNPPNFAQSHYVLEVNEVRVVGVLCFVFQVLM